MSIEKSIKNAVIKKELGGWKKYPQLFWVIDLHDTIIKATYDKSGIMDFFPNSINVLRQLSTREDMVLILWSSTHSGDLEHYLYNMRKLKIEFNCVNSNDYISSDNLRDVTKKLYFDILLDDKAGFNPKKDWYVIEETLIKLDLWRMQP